MLRADFMAKKKRERRRGAAKRKARDREADDSLLGMTSSSRSSNLDDANSGVATLPVPIGLSRRKLVDDVMAGFLIGNTAARSLLTPQDLLLQDVTTRSEQPPSPPAVIQQWYQRDDNSSSISLLFCGVGDVRNVLTTAESLTIAPPPSKGAAAGGHANEEAPFQSISTNMDSPPLPKYARDPATIEKSLPLGRALLDIHLNDISVATLARDIVLLHMAASSLLLESPTFTSSSMPAGKFSIDADAEAEANIDATIAVWSDALLTTHVFERLVSSLTALCAYTVDDMPFIFNFPDTQTDQFSTLAACKACFEAWLSMAPKLTPSQVHARRSTALALPGAGHGRAGVSRYWRETGLSSHKRRLHVSDMAKMLGNPTLFCPYTGRLLECQGPAGAFASLGGGTLQPGDADFARKLHAAWTPLLHTLRLRVVAKTIRFTFALGDCTVLMRRPEYANRFDAIDTSNLQDYLGLWTTLTCAQPCLRRRRPQARTDRAKGVAGSFVQTESILGLADTVEGMLRNEAPYDVSLHAVLLDAVGMCDHGLRREDDFGSTDERVVRVRWHLLPSEIGLPSTKTAARPNITEAVLSHSTLKLYDTAVEKIRHTCYRILEPVVNCAKDETEIRGKIECTFAKLHGLAALSTCLAWCQSLVLELGPLLPATSAGTKEQHGEERSSATYKHRPGKAASSSLGALLDEITVMASSEAEQALRCYADEHLQKNADKVSSSSSSLAPLLSSSFGGSSNKLKGIVCVHEALFAYWRAVAAPEAMAADSLDDVHAPIEHGYAWPTSTPDAFVQLHNIISARRPMARIPLHQLVPQGGVNAYPAWWGDVPRTRALALRISLAASATAAIAASATMSTVDDMQGGNTARRDATLRPAALLSPRPSQYSAAFSLVPEVLGPRGGTFEPALALCLIRDDRTLDRVRAMSGRYYKAHAGAAPDSQLRMWLATDAMRRSGPSVAMLDNLAFSFTAKSKGTATFNWPGNEAAYVAEFQWAILVDVQQYRLVSDAVKVASSFAPTAGQRVSY